MIEQNHEYYVSFEVAKLLKEAGFYWNCRGVYIGPKFLDVHITQVLNCTDYEVLKAPTLEIAQRWLREAKNLSVDTSSTRNSEWEYIIRKINQLNHNDNAILALTACRFYTCEEAQEAGIEKALEIALERGE